METAEILMGDENIAFFGGDDEEGGGGHSLTDCACSIALEIIAVTISAVIYFMATNLHWGNGLEFLTPAFFLFVSYQFIFKDYPKIRETNEV